MDDNKLHKGQGDNSFEDSFCNTGSEKTTGSELNSINKENGKSSDVTRIIIVTLAFLLVLAIVAICVLLVNVKSENTVTPTAENVGEIVQSTVTDSKTLIESAVTIKTDDNDSQTNSSAENINSQTEVSRNTEMTELRTETVTEITEHVTWQKTEPAPAPEPVINFDVDDSVAASYNSDGTIRLEYSEAPLTLTLPSSWKGKFAVRNGNLYSRTAYYSADINDGKLMTILFRDYEEGIEGITKYIGKAGNKYCYYARVTDLRFDMYNKEESDEYNFLMKDVQSIYESAVCVSYDNEIPAADRFPKYGEVSSHGQYVSGHSVLGGYGDWPVENGWHITAVSRSTYNGEIWYDCYDTDDGDHYGWINESYVYFY